MENRLMVNFDSRTKLFIKAVSALLALMILFFCVPSLADEDSEQGSFVILPEETAPYVWRLTDDDADSRISFDAGSEFTVRVPENTPALFFEWYSIPEGVVLSQLGGQGELLSETRCSGLYEDLVLLDPACSEVRVSSETLYSLSEVRICSEEEIKDYHPLKLPDKADILFILAHTGDEMLIFPGLDAKYACAEGLQTVHLYMSAKNRTQIRETIRALRLSGNYTQPVVLGYRYYFLDMKFIRYKAKFWDKKLTKSDLTSAIRRYRPEIVITHSADGDLDDGMSVFISEMTLESVKNAASSKEDRKSMAEYGPWNVSKVYLNAGQGDTTDATDPSIDDVSPQSLQGLTYREIAEEALSSYKTLAVFRYDISKTNPVLSLVKTSVGPDTADSDILDHIDPADLTNQGIAPPPPEPEPEPEANLITEEQDQEPEAAAEPVQEPEQPADILNPEDVQERSEKTSKLRLLLMAAAALFLLSLIIMIVLRAVKERFYPAAVVMTVIFAAVSAVLAGILFASRATGGPDQLEQKITAEIQEPAPEPTVEPADETEEDEVPVQQDETAPPEEDPNEAYFLSGTDEEVIADPDAGHWEYRTDSLSILIDKTSTVNANDLPIVYYIAHIRMRGYDSYRSGFGYFNEEGSAKAKPYEIARRYKAVLAITGDNLVNADVRNKGVLIRNRRLYSAGNRKTPTMAFHSDMSISIYDPSITAATIVEDGVQNSYGFGPILVEDGEANPELWHHRLNRANPRCGIGMVEPGHYVAIVGDGRQPNHSVGMSLVEFADLFLKEGCTVAYNMDGGVSAGMVFMGEHINRHRSSHTGRVSAQRPWPDALMFGYSELVPSVDDPIINTGNGNEADRNRKKMEDKNSDG